MNKATYARYPKRSDYTENKLWNFYIVGEELPEQREA